MGISFGAVIPRLNAPGASVISPSPYNVLMVLFLLGSISSGSQYSPRAVSFSLSPVLTKDRPFL